MLVSELKEEIKKYDKKELERIIIELYKRIPKNKKEDYNIDEFIKNLNSENKAQKKVTSFEDLKKEIIYFLECVDNELYVIPNKIISKKERSTWRFKAKKYYKELTSIPSSSHDGETATLLLIELFKRISIGSNRLLFSNWETFKAVGISQENFYDTIMKRIVSNGYTKDKLQKCIELLDIPKDPYTLSEYMFHAFQSNLKTIDTKEMAIEILDSKIKEFKIDLKEAKDYHEEYDIKENINDYTMCVTNIYFLLHEVNEGISYFEKNYVERLREIKEYVLLEELESFNLINYWLREYESKKDTIDFRKSLKEKYSNFKKSYNGEETREK